MRYAASILALVLALAFVEEARAGLIIIHSRDTDEQRSDDALGGQGPDGTQGGYESGEQPLGFAPQPEQPEEQDEESDGVIDLWALFLSEPSMGSDDSSWTGHAPYPHGVGPLNPLGQQHDGYSDDFDPEAMGCGGASAAAGPAGLLPLLVGVLPLFRRRRAS